MRRLAELPDGQPVAVAGAGSDHFKGVGQVTGLYFPSSKGILGQDCCDAAKLGHRYSVLMTGGGLGRSAPA